jgi:diguanylate cyclase (GGDEF)-like protein
MSKSKHFAKVTPIQTFSSPPKLIVTTNGASLTNLLLEVVQKLSLAKDLETIMFIVRRAARTLNGADGATFVLRDCDHCYYADEDAIAPLWKGKRFPMKICISGWVMEHREPVIIEDIYLDSRIPADAYRPTFVKSLAMVPIRTESPIGAIGTYWAEIYKPTEEQVNLLKSLADATSVAMENVDLHSKLEQGSKENSEQIEITKELRDTNSKLEHTLHELNRRNEEMQLLKKFSSLLQTCFCIDEAYQLIAEYTHKLLPDVAGVFYSMHPSRNYLEAMSSWANPLLEEKIIKPEECLGLRRGSVYSTDNPEKELICAHFKENKHLRPYSCIPLFAQSDILGLLYLEWKENDLELTKKSNQQLLATMVAEQIAIGLSNIQLRETLRNQSFRDALTGLYNRRYLEETLEREMSRCSRKSTNLALLMIDIDHFKQFNDNFGHEAGDIVIQSLATVLRDFVRKEDISCRYGGEEFIVIMPEVDLDAALERAQILHEEVSHIHLRYGSAALTQITISIGLAVFPLHANHMRGLITASDEALYQAKNSGRNKTMVYKST